MLRLRCSINCLNSSPDALRGTLGQRKGSEVSPESVAWHPWATERGGSVAGECCAAPLGGGKGRKCHRRVSRGTLGRRKGTEVSPGSVAGECRAVTELAEVAIFAGMVAVILRQMMANLPNCHIRGNGITFDNTPCVRLRERRRRKKNAALRIWLGKRKNDAQIR